MLKCFTISDCGRGVVLQWRGSFPRTTTRKKPMNDTSQYNIGTGMGYGKKERDKRRRAICCREGRETGDKALDGYKNGYD